MVGSWVGLWVVMLVVEKVLMLVGEKVVMLVEHWVAQ